MYNKLKFKSVNILIIGDIILDEYILGDVSRISQEAPVPIVRVDKHKYALGGAGNVAMNICSLSAHAMLIGVVGDDKEGDTTRDIFNVKGIDFDGIISKSRPTTLKTRVIGNNHQLVRYDKELTESLDEEDEKLLLKKFFSHIAIADIVVISDYNKGVCTENICKTIIKESNKLGKYVLIDPKLSDWSRYSDAYLIKPNQNEFANVIKYLSEDTSKNEQELLKQFEISNILITRSRDGMTLCTENSTINFKSEAKEVFDVSGAGDTVIATLAVFLASGAELNEAIKISNIAAGIAVSKAGTYSIKLSELETALNNYRTNKIITNDEILFFIEELKHQGKKIVFTNGCFDILHLGHISLLQQAKQQGDVLIVGMNSDSSIKRIKGESRPINCENDRAAVLSALESVDAIVIFNEDTPFELVKMILPDVMVKGADYKPENIAGADIVKANGGEIILVQLLEGKSSSSIISKLRD